MARYIFITGGVVSSLGKGLMAASLAALLQARGYKVRILYGGSVKPDNAAELLAADEVGGALVGGASLTAESFLGIIVAAAERGEG